MSGVLWAAASGVGFGLFQSLNGRAVRQLDDPYLSTFLQLLMAAAVLIVASAVTGDLARLGDASAWALVSFGLAGMLHFFLGWTLLNVSQDRIGAARTSPLLTMTPVFGVAVAAVTLGEIPKAAALAGIAVTVLGAWTVASANAAERARWRDTTFALGTAFMWALSPIFTLEGLEELDSPLLGVTVGLVCSVGAYALLLALAPVRRERTGSLSRDGVALKLICGALVALATWGRWIALDLTTVGAVLALGLLSVPVVLLLAPALAGRHVEAVTARVWAGAGMVVGGTLVLIVVG